MHEKLGQESVIDAAWAYFIKRSGHESVLRCVYCPGFISPSMVRPNMVEHMHLVVYGTHEQQV